MCTKKNFFETGSARAVRKVRLPCCAVPCPSLSYRPTETVVIMEGQNCVFEIKHGHFAVRSPVFVELEPLQIKSLLRGRWH